MPKVTKWYTQTLPLGLPIHQEDQVVCTSLKVRFCGVRRLSQE